MKELHKKAAIIVYKMQFSTKKTSLWMAKAVEASHCTMGANSLQNRSLIFYLQSNETLKAKFFQEATFFVIIFTYLR
jgi:hypothetical protein